MMPNCQEASLEEGVHHQRLPAVGWAFSRTRPAQFHAQFHRVIQSIYQRFLLYRQRISVKCIILPPLTFVMDHGSTEALRRQLLIIIGNRVAAIYIHIQVGKSAWMRIEWELSENWVSMLFQVHHQHQFQRILHVLIWVTLAGPLLDLWFIWEERTAQILVRDFLSFHAHLQYHRHILRPSIDHANKTLFTWILPDEIFWVKASLSCADLLSFSQVVYLWKIFYQWDIAIPFMDLHLQISKFLLPSFLVTMRLKKRNIFIKIACQISISSDLLISVILLNIKMMKITELMIDCRDKKIVQFYSRCSYD